MATKKNNSKKANVEVKAIEKIETPVTFTAKAASEQKAREEKAQTEKRNAYIDIVTTAPVEVKPAEDAAATVEENTATEQAAPVEVKPTEDAATGQTLEEFAASIGIKVDWNAGQAARWLNGAAQVDGKYIFVEDAVYKNIEKHEGWRPTYSAVKNGKLSRVGKNFGDALVKQGNAVIAKGIVEYREEKAAEKAKAKAEKAAARQAKKAASKK